LPYVLYNGASSMPSYSGGQTKKNEIDRACSTNGILWWDMRKSDHLEYQGVDGRILKKIFKKWNVGHEPD